MLEIEVSTSYTSHGHLPLMKVKLNEIAAVPLQFSEKHLKPCKCNKVVIAACMSRVVSTPLGLPRDDTSEEVFDLF